VEKSKWGSRQPAKLDGNVPKASGILPIEMLPKRLAEAPFALGSTLHTV